MTGPRGVLTDPVWPMIDAHRAAVADLLATLSDDDWRQPSLCAGWTVRDVAAHLTLQRLGPRDVLAMLRRWRGTMDRTIAETARRRAAELSTDAIVAGVRDSIGVHRASLGVSRRETLVDILVHGQDIARPLGRRLDMAPEAAASAATRVLSMRWPPPLPGARRVAGFRLVATDVSWSAGDGPEVRGPISALLLLCAGRSAALPELSGPGVADVSVRLQPREAP